MSEILLEDFDTITNLPLNPTIFNDLTLQNCSLSFKSLTIPFNSVVYSSRSILENMALNKYFKVLPWFTVDNMKFTLGVSTFNDVVNNLLDYISMDQNIDTTRNTPSKAVSELIIDVNNLRIHLSFTNMNNHTFMQGNSILTSFIIKYNSYNISDIINRNVVFSSYIPFNCTEDKWRFYTDIKPTSIITLDNTHCYQYNMNDIDIDIRFSTQNSLIVYLGVHKI